MDDCYMGCTHHSLQDNLESTVRSMFTVPNMFGAWHQGVLTVTGMLVGIFALLSMLCLFAYAWSIHAGPEATPIIWVTTTTPILPAPQSTTTMTTTTTGINENNQDYKMKTPQWSRHQPFPRRDPTTTTIQPQLTMMATTWHHDPTTTAIDDSYHGHKCRPEWRWYDCDHNHCCWQEWWPWLDPTTTTIPPWLTIFTTTTTTSSVDEDNHSHITTTRTMITTTITSTTMTMTIFTNSSPPPPQQQRRLPQHDTDPCSPPGPWQI